MKRVEVGGLEIAYERAGSGPPLVLLHGYVGDGATTWRRQLEGLSDDFTVVAWDAPGAGRSSDPPDRFGVDGYADCLAGSTDGWVWNEPAWPGCRLAVSSRLGFSGDTPRCRAT